jgi:hypothetical protein
MLTEVLNALPNISTPARDKGERVAENGLFMYQRETHTESRKLLLAGRVVSMQID